MKLFGRKMKFKAWWSLVLRFLHGGRQRRTSDHQALNFVFRPKSFNLFFYRVSWNHLWFQFFLPKNIRETTKSDQIINEIRSQKKHARFLLNTFGLIYALSVSVFRIYSKKIIQLIIVLYLRYFNNVYYCNSVWVVDTF